MPKETFYNLSQEKANRIIEAALDEFANVSFDKASINKIIEAAGIPKGSFYQYFDDKKDLYKFIINLSIKRKMESFLPLINEQKEEKTQDIFKIFRALYIAGIHFAKQNPKLVAIGNRFLLDVNHPVYHEIMKENGNLTNEMIGGLLSEESILGGIRKDIDYELLVLLLSTMSAKITELYFNLDHSETEQISLEKLDHLFHILKYGVMNTEN
jgi:AcrR family transcriptional regulator